MCTHPSILTRGERRVSDVYSDPLAVYAADDHPLSPPPEGTVAISLSEGLFGPALQRLHLAVVADAAVQQSAVQLRVQRLENRIDLDRQLARGRHDQRSRPRVARLDALEQRDQERQRLAAPGG